PSAWASLDASLHVALPICRSACHLYGIGGSSAGRWAASLSPYAGGGRESTANTAPHPDGDGLHADESGRSRGGTAGLHHENTAAAAQGPAAAHHCTAPDGWGWYG